MSNKSILSRHNVDINRDGKLIIIKLYCCFENNIHSKRIDIQGHILQTRSAIQSLICDSIFPQKWRHLLNIRCVSAYIYSAMHVGGNQSTWHGTHYFQSDDSSDLLDISKDVFKAWPLTTALLRPPRTAVQIVHQIFPVLIVYKPHTNL